MKIAALKKFTLSDFPGKISAIIFTQGCNFKCPYCHNPSLIDITSSSTIGEEEVLNFLKLRKGKLEGVVITGGEPTLQQDLVSFVKKIKKLGFFIKLDTNGSQPVLLQQLIEEKLVDYIAMDNKAPLPKYQQIVKSNIDPAEIAKSMTLTINSGIDYEFRTTVVKSQLSRNDLIDIAKQIKGAEILILQKFVPDHAFDKSFRTENTYTDSEFKAICEELEQYVNRCVLR